MDAHNGPIQGVSISRSGLCIATYDHHWSIIIWDAISGGVKREWLTADVHFGASISPDGMRLATADDTEITIWNAEHGTILSTIPVYSLDGPFPESITWLTDDILFFNDRVSLIYIWDIKKASMVRRIPARKRECTLDCVLRISDDGMWAILREALGRPTELWRLTDGALHHTLEIYDETRDQKTDLISTAFDVPHNTFTGMDSHGTVFRWNIETGERLHHVRVDGFSVTGIVRRILKSVVSRNGDWVCWTMDDDTRKVAHIAETKEGRRIWSTHGHRYTLESIQFSPDGELLATSSRDCALRLWRTRDGTCVASETHPKKWPAQLAFSEDGELLVMGAYDGTIRIIRIRDLEEME